MTDDVATGGFDRGDPAIGGEAGSRRETPYVADPTEDLGRQDGTDAEQAGEAAVGVLDRRGDALIDARHGRVEPAYLADEVHRQEATRPRRTGRGPEVA